MKNMVERHIGSDWSPHVEEQKRSKDIVLW